MRLPGHYCDKEEKVNERMEDTTDFIKDVFDDGLVLGVKIGMVAGFLLAGLGVVIAWPW